MSESEFLSPSFDEEGLTKKIEEKVQEGEEEGPAANSTPFLKRLSRCNGVRGSISDEIKVLGVREMTPFCEKSALHNDSNSVVAKHIETVECATQTALFDRWNEPETDLQKPDQILSNIAAIIFLAMMAAALLLIMILFLTSKMFLSPSRKSLNVPLVPKSWSNTCVSQL